MDMQSVINAVVVAVIAAIGWFARQLWEAVADLRKDVKDIEVALPTNYVRKDEFVDALRDLKKEISDGFTRIYDKIDAKADKN